MSEMFEAILLNRPTEAALAAAATNPGFTVAPITADVSAALRVAPRNQPFDIQRIVDHAAHLAPLCESCLALFYDNRIGLRQAFLLEHGSPVRTFGPADEVWAPLDDRGEPIATGQRLSLSDLDPNDEYECTVSAIDAAITAAGIQDTIREAHLLQLFCYSDTFRAENTDGLTTR